MFGMSDIYLSHLFSVKQNEAEIDLNGICLGIV